MKRCNAKPYEGNDEYIFVSYCHRDRVIVYPIIENLARDGYRVWYDEGIDPGSEWPEIIASHLNGCAVCIAFISNNSLNSHNCKREVSFAHLKKKDFISIITEPVKLTLGMEMQLSASQSIFKYTIDSDSEFYEKLYDARFLERCKGEKNYSIKISVPSDYEDDISNDMFAEKELVRKPFSDKWFSDNKDEAKVALSNGNNHDETNESKYNNKKSDGLVEFQKQQLTNVLEDNSIEPVLKQNQRLNEIIKPESQGNLKKNCLFTIKRNRTGELYRIIKERMIIGRSESMADIQIHDNSTIGRVHATLLIRNGECYIIDCN